MVVVVVVVDFLTPLLLFVLDLKYQLFLHCCFAVVVGKILTDTSRHVIYLL